MAVAELANFTQSTDDLSLNDNYTFNANISDWVKLTENLVLGLIYFYTPFLVSFGLLGNFISIYVFYKSELRVQSTSQYLTALAVTDSVFLSQLIPGWFYAMQVTDIFRKEGICQTIAYVSYVCCTMSAWLVVAFTIERFLAVVYPLQRHLLCTVSKSRIVIKLLIVLALVMNLPILRYAKPSETDCTIDMDYITAADRFNTIDTAINFTAPLAIIIVLNVGIVVGVCRLKNASKIIIREMGSSVNSNSIRLMSAPCTQYRVTRMIVVVSSVYVLLNLPAYTMRIMVYHSDMTILSQGGLWSALQQIGLIVFNTNFGINFLLYCMSGYNFRKALYQVLPVCKWPKCMRRQGRLVRRPTPFRPATLSWPSRSQNKDSERTRTVRSPQFLGHFEVVVDHRSTRRRQWTQTRISPTTPAPESYEMSVFSINEEPPEQNEQ